MANRKWLGLIVLSVAAIVMLGVGLGLGLAGGSRASTEPSNEITKAVCQGRESLPLGVRLKT
jgi:predicted Na+-dependent transporter